VAPAVVAEGKWAALRPRRLWPVFVASVAPLRLAGAELPWPWFAAEPSGPVHPAAVGAAGPFSLRGWQAAAALRLEGAVRSAILTLVGLPPAVGGVVFEAFGEALLQGVEPIRESAQAMLQALGHFGTGAHVRASGASLAVALLRGQQGCEQAEDEKQLLHGDHLGSGRWKAAGYASRVARPTCATTGSAPFLAGRVTAAVPPVLSPRPPAVSATSTVPCCGTRPARPARCAAR
jgi:hypothetical protein